MPYDAAMVRDFIEHLKWSLKVEYLQLKTGTLTTLQPEMLQNLRDLAQKYGVASLTQKSAAHKDRDDLTDNDLQKAENLLRTHAMTERERQIKCLEQLSMALDQACTIAAGQDAHANVPASKILDGSAFANPES